MDVVITPPAQKQYKKLPDSEQNKIDKKLSVLKSFPESGKKLSGEVDYLRAIRAWPYRILYYIDEKQKTIFIVTIAHRQGVYK